MIDKQLPVISSAIMLGSYRPNHLTLGNDHLKYRVSINVASIYFSVFHHNSSCPSSGQHPRGVWSSGRWQRDCP